MSNIVAIVGRPNVGKSTLFNRLIGERKSIIDDVSGVTRDRIYGFSEWGTKSFTVVDTGGFVHGSEDIFESAIRSQVQIAIDEATVILFMTDVTTGITDLDAEIADKLRRGKKPVICIVNKVDNSQRDMLANEFWALGFENTLFLSSITGSGTGELMDLINEFLPEDSDDINEARDLPRIAVVGQPNVGKSSFTNALLGEDRNIVTDIPGTTRDAIYTQYDKFGHKFYLIDTAGIRKKNKVHEDLEFYSVIRAVRTIEEADVCILMLDATVGVESQDLSLLSLITRKNKGLVILINKWDLIENKETNTARDFENELKERIAPFTDVPIVTVSVLEKQRIFKAVEIAMEVYENRSRKIKTSELNDSMLAAIDRYQPPSHRGKFIKIKFVTQLPLPYPAFAFFCNHPKHVKDNYKNYLENQLRLKYNFSGVPISIFFREK
ncbi:MAG: ribosome biogenesis GTPase Der [Saprospiraceae bacterium]|nr:ribosome biogenesis GTPase Der [Saprospiraceae bacterium]MBK8850684.1 ribosome biogenesis GTPase Der [Saprospiraceae bacterium]MBL0081116.1 ribosome biogenesis GTPase Der [Saprospiraceae bacterium]